MRNLAESSESFRRVIFFPVQISSELIVDKKNYFFPLFQTPPLQDRQKRYLFSIFSDVEDHLEQTVPRDSLFSRNL